MPAPPPPLYPMVSGSVAFLCLLRLAIPHSHLWVAQQKPDYRLLVFHYVANQAEWQAHCHRHLGAHLVAGGQTASIPADKSGHPRALWPEHFAPRSPQVRSPQQPTLPSWPRFTPTQTAQAENTGEGLSPASPDLQSAVALGQFKVTCLSFPPRGKCRPELHGSNRNGQTRGASSFGRVISFLG